MKKFLLIIFILIGWASLNAQDNYWSSSGEMILSFSNASYDNYPNAGENTQVADAPRFTLWLHFGYYYNMDFSKNFGLYTGLTMRNIGFISKEKSSVVDVNNPNYNMDVKWKRRSYALGIPLTLKVGKLDEKGTWLFVGGQYEWMFHYKEKEFLNSGKRKYSEWFSQRVNQFIPSVFAGITFPYGFSLKFTYMLDDLMNKDYSYSTNSGVVKPYKDLNSKIFYISIFVNSRFQDYFSESKEVKKIAVL